MPRRLRPLAAGLLALLPGCAPVACRPATIEVAARETRSRLDSEPRVLRTDAQGRLGVDQRQVIVTEYWVQDRQGRWYRVPESAWQGAEPGRPLAVCR